MPIYEYRCSACHERVSILVRSISKMQMTTPRCPHCGSQDLRRLISRVAVVRSEEARLESLADMSTLSDIDENNPRTIGRWIRRMSAEMGENLSAEFAEVADRLEAGQTPEEIESTMPELGISPEDL